jgi:hypothetical protein
VKRRLAVGLAIVALATEDVLEDCLLGGWYPRRSPDGGRVVLIICDTLTGGRTFVA